MADGTLTPDAVRKASGALHEVITTNEAQLSTLAGRSALDRFAGRVVADWDTFDVDDRRAILLSLLKCVQLQSSNGKTLQGTGRLQLVWKFAVLGAIDWAEVEFTDADLVQQPA